MVDDVKVNLVVVKGLLKDSGIEIDTAESGAEAIEKMKESRYDIVFLDHMMPEMDGVGHCLASSPIRISTVSQRLSSPLQQMRSRVWTRCTGSTALLII